MRNQRTTRLPGARPSTRWTFLPAVIATVMTATAPAQTDDQTTIQTPVRAITRASEDLRLAFPVPGRVAETLVEPGDKVAKGQTLIILERADSAARVELLRTRAQSTIEIERAYAAWELAKVREAGVRQAFDRGAGATFELQEAELQTQASLLALELRKQRKREAELELQQAEALHAQRELTAAIDGVVDIVLVSTGDTVQAFDAIARLVSTNKLWVDASTPTKQTLSLTVGDPVWVRYVDDPDAPIARGFIKHLAQVADASSGTRLVRIEINNPDAGPAGRHVEVFFEKPPSQ